MLSGVFILFSCWSWLRWAQPLSSCRNIQDVIFVFRLLSRSRASTSSSLDLVERPDRKSTRLNSSHVSVSYAVFSFKRQPTVKPSADVRPLAVLVVAHVL